ncbi:MAG: lysozyme [Bacteroidales bacterium]
MTTSDKGYTLIKYFEGKETLFSLLPELKSYRCPSGYWTLGWGTIIYPDGTPVREGDRCTVQQARRWLIYDVQEVEHEVHALFPIVMTQGNFDSLVSFGYNAGTAEKGLGGSTLRKRILAGASPELIEAAFNMWCKGNGEHDGKDNDNDGLVDEAGEKQIKNGLVRRRKAEAWLYRYDEMNLFLD